MKIHYYSGWFDEALPASYLESLRKDITNKKSLVLVWGCWGGDELIDFVKDSWLKPGGIDFDEIHLVDNRTTKEEGHKLIREASALLLLGGDDVLQSKFFEEYELAAPIKESKANLIMGFSAGAINMPSICINFENETTTLYDGLGLDEFCYVPYFYLDKEASLSRYREGVIENDLLPLSQNIDVYVTTPESFIRIEAGAVKAFGDAWLISDSAISKI